MLVPPVILLPLPCSNQIVLHILRIRENLNAGYAVPRRVLSNPFQHTDAGEKLHSIVVAFLASEIDNLFVLAVQVVGIVNNRGTARPASRILIAGAVR